MARSHKKNEVRPQRQRGRPKRYDHDDEDGSDSVGNSVAEHNGGRQNNNGVTKNNGIKKSTPAAKIKGGNTDAGDENTERGPSKRIKLRIGRRGGGGDDASSSSAARRGKRKIDDVGEEESDEDEESASEDEESASEVKVRVTANDEPFEEGTCVAQVNKEEDGAPSATESGSSLEDEEETSKSDDAASDDENADDENEVEDIEDEEEVDEVDEEMDGIEEDVQDEDDNDESNGSNDANGEDDEDEDLESSANTPGSKTDEASVSSKDAPIADERDDDDLGEGEIKVRVRLASNLRDEICRAILPLELRDKIWEEKEESDSSASEDSDAVTSEDDQKPAAPSETATESDEKKESEGESGAKPEAMEVDEPSTPKKEGDKADQDAKPKLDFAVTDTPSRKSNGAILCRAVGCPKISQSHSEGFCRAHHNRFLICTGQCSSWNCLCGEKIASFQARCGQCHRWRDGKHAGMSSGSKKKKTRPIPSPAKGSILNPVVPKALDGALNESVSADVGAEGTEDGGKAAGKSALTYVPPDSGVQISSQPRTNDKGRSLCKVVGCNKMDQSNNDGFCRMHFNMFAISSDADNWTCVCGQVVGGKQKRCGNCNKWKGGKRDPYNINKLDSMTEGNYIGEDGQEYWKCECGNEVPATKARCGRCHHWRGGRRQGGWKLGSAMGREYESDDGIDRTKEWSCCGTTIPAKQTRCGKCNGWRGGKRIASKALPEIHDNRPKWICAKCQIPNPASKRRCGGCQSWKGGRSSNGKGGGSSANFRDTASPLEDNRNWRCKKCAFENFETEIECFICQAVRPNWQWHKRQQQISNGNAAPAAQHPTQAATSSKLMAGRVPASTESANTQNLEVKPQSLANKGEGEAATAQINNSHASTTTTDSDAEMMHYYGYCDENMSYPLIRIHYDFNRSYYKNHDYTYLNSGIGSRSSMNSSSEDGNQKKDDGIKRVAL